MDRIKKETEERIVSFPDQQKVFLIVKTGEKMMAKVTEHDLVNRVTEILENISKEDFLTEVNHLLGTSYVEDDVEWNDS